MPQAVGAVEGGYDLMANVLNFKQAARHLRS
jgi:hypothetical protein